MQQRTRHWFDVSPVCYQIDLRLTAPFALSLQTAGPNCKHQDFRSRKRLLPFDKIVLALVVSNSVKSDNSLIF
jgi:hypothetical protein